MGMRSFNEEFFGHVTLDELPGNDNKWLLKIWVDERPVLTQIVGQFELSNQFLYDWFLGLGIPVDEFSVRSSV